MVARAVLRSVLVFVVLDVVVVDLLDVLVQEGAAVLLLFFDDHLVRCGSSFGMRLFRTCSLVDFKELFINRGIALARLERELLVKLRSNFDLNRISLRRVVKGEDVGDLGVGHLLDFYHLIKVVNTMISRDDAVPPILQPLTLDLRGSHWRRDAGLFFYSFGRGTLWSQKAGKTLTLGKLPG